VKRHRRSLRRTQPPHDVIYASSASANSQRNYAYDDNGNLLSSAAASGAFHHRDQTVFDVVAIRVRAVVAATDDGAGLAVAVEVVGEQDGARAIRIICELIETSGWILGTSLSTRDCASKKLRAAFIFCSSWHFACVGCLIFHRAMV